MHTAFRKHIQDAYTITYTVCIGKQKNLSTYVQKRKINEKTDGRTKIITGKSK